MKENKEKTYIFYMNSGYVGGTAKEEVTGEEVGITDNTTQEEDEELLQEYYQEFLGSLDSGRYEKN